MGDAPNGTPLNQGPEVGLDVRLVLATSTGGVGAHVRALVQGLAGRGDRVLVAGPAQTEERFGFTAAGAAFEPVEIATGARPIADARAVRRMRPLLAGAEVVHAHGLRAGLLCGAALGAPAQGGVPPLVVTLHNAVLGHGPRRRILARMEATVCRRASILLGVSPDLVDRAKELGARDARLIDVAAPPMPRSSRSREEVRVDLGASRSPLVVSVGRLAPQKSFGTLLEACRLWRDRPDRPLTLIAGDGPLRGELQRRIEREGLAVRLLGHRDDVGDLLAAADVAVLPSAWEGRPLVAEEVLRAGVPLVATAVGGIPDLVGDAAVLVPPADPGALASAVLRLLDDPALRRRLASDGQLRAAGLPTEADTAAAVRRIYAELTDRR